MCRKFGFIICAVLAILLASCKGDVINAGSSNLESADSIIVLTDTFYLSSGLTESPGVISSPDSFMVGELETRYGTLRAGVLTQLSCPVGFVYPQTAEIDSMTMYIYYRTWVGDGLSALALDVFEADGEVLEYSPDPENPYLTSRDVNDFCSATAKSILQEQRIVIPAVPTDSVYNSAISSYIYRVGFKLTDDFVSRFTSVRSFEDQDTFNEFFKGLYIVSDFGSASILNILDINVGVYYHFSFDEVKEGGEIVRDTVSDVKAFYANSEVRQLNLFEYLNDDGKRSDWKDRLSMEGDTSYVIAPAGIYTSLALPIRAMRDTIFDKIGDRRPYVNLARVRLNVIQPSGAQKSWLSPAQSLLLMRKTQDMENHADLESFFAKRTLPSDTLAILASLQSEVDSLGDTQYFYSFDLSGLLTYQLREESLEKDTLHMVVVPVSVATTTSSSGISGVTGVRQAQTPSLTMVKAVAESEDQKQMMLNVVYSGF